MHDNKGINGSGITGNKEQKGYNQMKPEKSYILIVDDNESIHSDIKSIFMGPRSPDDSILQQMEQELFGDGFADEEATPVDLQIDHAYQGQEAVEMVRKAEKSGRPYELIYMDVRMPPGMDGIETIGYIKRQFRLPDVIICSAYSDYSVNQIEEYLGDTDNLRFMSKPFDMNTMKQTVLDIVQPQGRE